MCFIAGARVLGTGADERVRYVLFASRERLGRALAVALGLLFVACAVALARLDTASDVDRLRRRSQIMRTIDTQTSPGDRVLVATTSVWDPYPALTLQDRWPGSRYLWLFPIPMLEAVEPDGGELEQAFVSELAEDIRERRPKLLLLQKGRCFGCKKSSVDAFFRGHPPLEAALRDYSLRGTVRDGQELEVFVRAATEP
jgi:hypothetical protein